MAEYIFIKLGDEMYEKTFKDTFKGIIIETPHRKIVLHTKDFLNLLTSWEVSEMEKDIKELESKGYF